jgi:NADH-quinone oxidoreductase subunit E
MDRKERQMAEIKDILDRYPDTPDVLIQLLLDVQGEMNWISKESVQAISRKLNVPMSQIYRIASFYTAMSLEPRGRNVVSVCMGTACHVRGAPKIMDKMEYTLGVRAGETTSDMKYTLERVNCLGCCAMGPVVTVNKDYYSKLNPAKVKEVLEHYT